MNEQLSAKVERRPLTFGRPRIVALLAAVLLMSAVVMQLSLPAYRNWEAIPQIERMGGIVVTEEGGPAWLRRVVGNRAMEPFAQLYQVWFPVLTDAELSQLDLARHKMLTNLSLSGSRVSDDGLKYLSSLANVKFLYLDDTSITDAGLVHLQHLRNVQALSLCRTKVTESGVVELQRALPGVAVVWGDSSPTVTP